MLLELPDPLHMSYRTIIKGLTSILSCRSVWHFFDTLSRNLLLMVLPGLLFGACIGPWLNTRLGSERVMLFFSVLLILEFCMTFIKLVVLY